MGEKGKNQMIIFFIWIHFFYITMGGSFVLDPKIKTFMTLAREGSYTRTAKILSLTQPAVSHQMRQLEEIYQIKLFYPGKKRWF